MPTKVFHNIQVLLHLTEFDVNTLEDWKSISPLAKRHESWRGPSRWLKWSPWECGHMDHCKQLVEVIPTVQWCIPCSRTAVRHPATGSSCESLSAVERQTSWRCPRLEHLRQMASLAGQEWQSLGGVLPHLVLLVDWEFWLCGACLGFLFTSPPHLPLLTTPTGISVAGVSPFRRGCCLLTSSAWRTFATDVDRVNSTSSWTLFLFFFWLFVSQ